MARRFRRIRRFKRRAKKRLPNPLGSRIQNTVRKCRFNITAYTSLSQAGAGAGGYADNCTVFAINYPTYFRNALGTYGQMPNHSNLFIRAFNLFDMYKVNSIKIVYIPNEVNTLASGTNPDIVNAPTVMYGFKDIDDVSALASELFALNAGARAKNMSFTQTWIFRNKSPWKNTSDVGVVPGGAITSSNTPAGEQQYAGVKLYMPNLQYPPLGSTYWFGRFYVTWDCMFKGVNTLTTAA